MNDADIRVNEFNPYFVNIAKNLAASIPVADHFSTYLNDPSDNTEHFDPRPGRSQLIGRNVYSIIMIEQYETHRVYIVYNGWDNGPTCSVYSAVTLILGTKSTTGRPNIRPVLDNTFKFDFATEQDVAYIIHNYKKKKVMLMITYSIFY